jgi:hypothetical protein
MNIKSFLLKMAIAQALFGQIENYHPGTDGRHAVQGYRNSGRDGFAYIVGCSRMKRRKLATGR